MKPYKSLFRENSNDDLKQVIDISNLIWEKNSLKKPMSWVDANEYAKSLGNGWRLPTIQELYTASVLKIKGFKGKEFWSSTMPSQNAVYWFNFIYEDIGISSSDEGVEYFMGWHNVRCVKSIL